MTTASVDSNLSAYNFNLETSAFLAGMQKASPFHLVGQTFLHELARGGDILSAEVIMDTGIDIDLPDEEGRRPLHEAAFFGHEEMIGFLLSHGAKIDAPIMPFGYTALWYAVQQGHYDIARLLIEKGASLKVEDRLSGQGLLHIAASRGDVKMAGILLSAGIDVFKEDRRGLTARDNAARNNHKELERCILKVMTHRAVFAA